MVAAKRSPQRPGFDQRHRKLLGSKCSRAAALTGARRPGSTQEHPRKANPGVLREADRPNIVSQTMPGSAGAGRCHRFTAVQHLSRVIEKRQH